MYHHRFYGLAAFALIAAGTYFSLPASEAEAKCRNSNPCANGVTAVVDCPGGAVHVSGAAEVVCKQGPGGSQVIGIIGGGTAPMAEAPAPKPVVKANKARTTVQATATATANAASLPTRGDCRTGPMRDEAITITILPCPSGSYVKYVAGVPGQATLIKHGLIAMQNSAAPDGCLWLKRVRKTQETDKWMNKKVTTTYVVIPAQGVLRPEGGISLRSNSGRVAALEIREGACGNGWKSKPHSLAQLLALRR